VTVFVDTAEIVVPTTVLVKLYGFVTNAAWLVSVFALITLWETDTLSRVWMLGRIGDTAAALNFRKVV
jgi:hypothetical protein